MFFSKKCTLCRSKVGKEGFRRMVEVYGLVGMHRREFCSERCLDIYSKRTAMLMTTRKPNLCMKC